MILAYTFLVLNTLLAIFIIIKYKNNFLHPIVFYSIGHIIAYNFGMLSYIYVNSYIIIGIFDSQIRLFNIIEVVAFIYYLSLLISFYIFSRYINIKNSNYKISLIKVKKIGFIYLFIFVIVLLFFISKKGIYILQGLDSSYRVYNTMGMGIFKILINIFYTYSIGLLVYYYAITSKYKLFIVYILFLFLAFLHFLTFGARTAAFLPIIMSIMIPVYINRFKLKKILLVLVFIAPFIMLLENLRNKGEFVFSLNLAQLVYTIKGGFAHFAGLFAILENIGEKLDYQVFSNYKDILIYWIPRAIYPDKPIQFGDSGYITRTLLDNYTFTMVTSNIGEWILNLGYPGILVGGFIVGFVLRLFYLITQKAILYKNPADIIFGFSLLFTSIGLATRSGLEGFLTYLPVPLTIYFLTKQLIKQKKEINEDIIN